MTTPDYKRAARRPRRFMFPALWVLVWALVVSVPAQADSKENKKQASQAADYALIFGTVWSPDQRPAGGVRVKIRRANEKKPRWELLSDARGEFAQRVPPGAADYVVWADIKAPKGQPKPETRVRIESNERVDIGLHLTE